MIKGNDYVLYKKIRNGTASWEELSRFAFSLSMYRCQGMSVDPEYLLNECKSLYKKDRIKGLFRKNLKTNKS